MKENRGMRAETARPGKRPLRALSAAEKMEAIQRVHDGESKASVARDIGVPESTLRGWCKSEHKIRGMARNSSTPDSEAHSPASSSGTNVTNSQNAATSHSSEDEGPIQKRMKTEHQVPVGHSHGVDSTESNDSKVDYLGLMSMASSVGMRADSSALLLQHLGMMSASAKNYMSMSGLAPSGPVGLVENGLQYTKSGAAPSLNSKRHTISAIAPTQMDSMAKSVSRKSLPPAAEAPVTQVPASPNVQLPPVHLANVQMPSHQQSNPISNHQQSNLLTSHQQTNQLSNQLLTQLTSSMANQLPNVPVGNDRRNGSRSSSGGRRLDEALWMWLTHQQHLIGQQATPLNPAIFQEGSWFWQWYKQYGFNLNSSAAPNSLPLNNNALGNNNAVNNNTVNNNAPVNSAPKTSPSKARAVLDNLFCTNNNDEAPKQNMNVEEEVNPEIVDSQAIEEAIEHGEKFFQWLDKCSDPAVSRVQIVHLRILLERLKESRNRRESPTLKRSRK